MNIYLTTDTHFNHKDKMKEYCNRPDNYEHKIQTAFKGLTNRNLLIHLGDVCIGNDLNVHRKYIEPLECKAILVRGNHDRKSNQWYMTHGWDFVCTYFSIGRAKKNILFSHTPMAWDGYYNMNIHGHFHNANHRRWEDEFKKVKNAGQHLLALEYNNYQLFNLDKLLETTNGEA